MPKRDGRGPIWGGGPGAGWGLGPCGCGCGHGFHRGFGWHSGGRFQRMRPEDEKEMLENERQLLQEDLKDIEERLSELK